MIKLLPYQENFILSLLLLFLSFSLITTSHPYLISRLFCFSFLFPSRHLCYSHKFYVASWWWLHSYNLPFDDVTDNLSDTKKMVKSSIRGGRRKKDCVMKNSVGFVVLVVILPFVCFLSTILTTNSNSAGFIWIFSIASVSDHKNKLRSGIHISHYPFELYIRVILIPRKKNKSRKEGLCIVYMKEIRYKMYEKMPSFGFFFGAQGKRFSFKLTSFFNRRGRSKLWVM
jgi:hypothetical protein